MPTAPVAVGAGGTGAPPGRAAAAAAGGPAVEDLRRWASEHPDEFKFLRPSRDNLLQPLPSTAAAGRASPPSMARWRGVRGTVPVPNGSGPNRRRNGTCTSVRPVRKNVSLPNKRITQTRSTFLSSRKAGLSAWFSQEGGTAHPIRHKSRGFLANGVAACAAPSGANGALSENETKGGKRGTVPGARLRPARLRSRAALRFSPANVLDESGRCDPGGGMERMWQMPNQR